MCNNIKLIREKLSITQKELSELVGISRQYISEIECKKKIPTIRIAFDIAEALNTSVEEVFYICWYRGLLSYSYCNTKKKSISII